MFNPNSALPDFQSQQAALEQQKMLADALRKQAASAQQPTGQMVGRRYVRPNILQHLAPVLDKFQAGQAQRDVGAQEQQYAGGVQQATQDWQSKLPQARAAVPATPSYPGDEYGNEGVQGQPAQPAQMPDRGTVLKATLAGMNIPGNANAAMLWNKAMGEDIAREDAQADKRETRAETLKQQAQLHADKLAQQAEDAKRRSEDTRLSIEQRREAAQLMAEARRAHEATMRAIASMKAETPKPAKPLPSAQSKSWIENNTALSNIDAALAAVTANPKAFGVKNYLGDAAMQRLDPKGVEARSIVADIGSLKVHDRSGAAVSAAEDKRLAPFIPRAEDTHETVVKKLKQFQRIYNQIQAEIVDFAETQGYIVPQMRGAQPAAAAKPPGQGESKVVNGKTYVKRDGQWYEQ